jgi:hypothetical protein
MKSENLSKLEEKTWNLFAQDVSLYEPQPSSATCCPAALVNVNVGAGFPVSIFLSILKTRSGL